MKILFLEADQIQEYNCSHWRCVMPARALCRAGHDARVVRLERWIMREPDAVAATEDADIIFFQRNLFHDALQTMFYWRSRGKTVVVDLDDAYEHMTEETGSPSYAFWAKGIQTMPDGKQVEVNPKPLQLLRYGVKLSAGVSSPSQLICDDWSKYGRTYWFPNYMDISTYIPGDTYRNPNEIRIGWGGSMTHLVSWTKSGAAEALTQIAKENKDVIILLIGDPRLERHFADVPKKQRAAIGWAPQAVFASKLAYMDIGLAPLYGEYDRRRSWIKAAEYGVMGIPWIGSDSEPTRGLETGMLVKNTVDDWYAALKFYIQNLGALKQAAVANMPVAREAFDIDRHVEELVTLCEKIIEEDKGI